MTSRRIALIACPKEEALEAVHRKIYGLTVGERLLLSLEKAGITRVSFVGDGPHPSSKRAGVEIIDPDAAANGADEYVVVPADLVFDPQILSSGQPAPTSLPIKIYTRDEVKAVIENPSAWLESIGNGVAGDSKGYAVRVRDEDLARSASKSLIRSLAKDADGIISRNLNRKISTSITKILVNTPIKPNHVTLIVFLVGAASFPLASMGTYLGLALAGFCYWFSAVLDGCDGEISRLKYQGSPLGAWLDTIVDDLVGLFFVCGMYMGLHRNADHPYWYWIGVGGVSFYLATILPRYYIMATRSGSGDYQKMAKEIRPENRHALARFGLAVRDIVFRTDFLPFYAMVCSVTGFVEAFAVPFALGAVASAIDTFVTVVKYKPTLK